MLSSVSSNLTPSFTRKCLLISTPRTSSSKSHVCFALPPSPTGEEARWLREEQRWLREEQRWLREEQRWNAERNTFLHEITRLQRRIEELESLNSLQGTSVSEMVAKLLQVAKEGDLERRATGIAETGSTALPLIVEASAHSEELEVISIPDASKKTIGRRESLRKGAQGDDVHAMQEALQKLGFYCGEEDMEFSSFSSGTERAVRTWQATVGEPEDGVLTADLLDRLFQSSASGREASSIKTANGAATEISGVQQTVAPESVAEVGASQRRVFLLGENRWEEPSRLQKINAITPVTGTLVTKCLSCRGEGRLLCTECDGTGEPNVEPQFLEWVEEGTKCPYCDGLGYTTCDACDGRTTLISSSS